jgi:hypothetical protein
MTDKSKNKYHRAQTDGYRCASFMRCELNYFPVLAIATILVSGCASNQFAVTFDSNPQGAMLVCNGERWGYTPETFYFPKSEALKGNGLDLDYCSAV